MIARPLLALAVIASAPLAGAQEPSRPPTPLSERAAARRFESVSKAIDDVYWHFKVGDIAQIDKITIAASKPIRMSNPTGQGAGNPLLIYGYTFVPKSLGAKKAPLIVFVHGGVHGDFDTGFAHILRELLEQGYVVTAPEYRGSTGYGGEFYDQIDYGGTEIDDTHDIRDWAVENIPQVDPTKVGIIGWSHGGYHALFNVFRWPADYKVAYAGVPVSDLVQRMGYKSQGYRDLFASFIGKSAEDNPMEYRRRSPVNHVDKLATPLLVHTNTNDEDVNVMEVQHLIDALKAAGKTFEYKIYQDAPGGHAFNTIDTKLARESRREIWAFLAKHLR
ncbi:MAG: S9 family peptidase [Gemmatimonadetes bacterium]|nr:S9 family peptidase [Gemmatimonadota bacterium]